MHPRSPQGNTTERRARIRNTTLIGLLGAYCNIVAYGFAYGRYNHEFELALANWLRNPSLYPHDPITEAFARFPTVFWPATAYLSQWLSTEKVLFLFFLLTKLFFFLALARLVARTVKDNRLIAWIVLSVALSPFLNDFTPFGATDILNAVQTHTSLAVALLLWAGVFLVEEHWLGGTLLCALTIYLDALFVVYTLFAFAAFAVVDWPRRRKRILVAALLGAAITLPWVILSRGIFFRGYPPDYVEALLAFYPFHLTLRSHAAYDLLCGAGLLVAAVLMVVVAAKATLARHRRLELLAASYLIPVLLGASFGELLLTPQLARLQFLRADSFLVLYAILLIQIYGAELLLARRGRSTATTFFFSALAILLPLSDLLGLLWALFIAMFLWAYHQERLEGFFQAMARRRSTQALGLLVLLAGITVAGRADADWTSAVVILLTVTGGCLLASGRSANHSAARLTKLTAGVSAIAFIMVAVGTVPKLSNLWNAEVAPKPLEADWLGAQQWAKANTPQDAQFLVPTYPGGFRVFSERSSWGEWKDGQAAYHFPPFADVYRERMQALGFPWRPEWIRTKTMMANYKRLSWERLLSVAQANHLSYIIQFRDVNCPTSPVFANHSYAIYKVPP